MAKHAGIAIDVAARRICGPNRTRRIGLGGQRCSITGKDVKGGIGLPRRERNCLVAGRAYDCKASGHGNGYCGGMEAHCGGIGGLSVTSGKDELDEGKDEGPAGTLAYEDNRGGWDRKMVRIRGWVKEAEIG